MSFERLGSRRIAPRAWHMSINTIYLMDSVRSSYTLFERKSGLKESVESPFHAQDMYHRIPVGSPS